ncbi:MAG: DNA adenine methylase [Treponema sp.]|nr:DNA adenine methylase [Treponema sp.]
MFCKNPEWFNKSYITKIVNHDDIIYCDPSYHGRYADYYNEWTDEVEYDLYELLSNTKG